MRLLRSLLKYALLVVVFVGIAGLSAYLTLSGIIKSEDTVVVPDLGGMHIVSGLKRLSGLGLNTKVSLSEYHPDIARDHVIHQDPQPGTEIKKGRDVLLVLSKGRQTIAMSDMVGLALHQAEIELANSELCLGVISRTHSREITADRVIAQAPAAHADIARDACVNLLVSSGPPPMAYRMPDFTGLTHEEALPRISTLNLKTGRLETQFHAGQPDGRILAQTPPPGYRVLAGELVDLIVNTHHPNQTASLEQRTRGPGLFRYRMPDGFMKRPARVRLKAFGLTIDLVNQFMKPGEEIWSLIPPGREVYLAFYLEDERLNPDDLSGHFATPWTRDLSSRWRALVPHALMTPSTSRSS